MSTTGRATRSPASSARVPTPQASSSRGSAPASASSAASPTLVSSADDTTTGNCASASTCSATASERRTPPSGVHFTTATSAAPARATASGSSARRIDSSAATGTCDRRRTSASSATVAHGCSAYCRPRATSSSTPSASTAASTLQRPFASTRTCPPGPSASRTAATRSASAARDSSVSATLTFAVRQPERSTSSWARSGPTAGTMALTGTQVPHACRPAEPRRLQCGREPDGGHRVVVLLERAEVSPPARPLDEDALAHRDTPETFGHGYRVDVHGGRRYLRNLREVRGEGRRRFGMCRTGHAPHPRG